MEDPGRCFFVLIRQHPPPRSPELFVGNFTVSAKTQGHRELGPGLVERLGRAKASSAEVGPLSLDGNLRKKGRSPPNSVAFAATGSCRRLVRRRVSGICARPGEVPVSIKKWHCACG